ncbi:polysaccharide pyruvyl transferase family protein [Alkalibacterium indicireducens]|uniref:Polysaccharide pyruvyl transferase domain-containing protein n=1 Tax=Alkalibacterium indicireducens TaxID=398758 RepID=A0ABP3KFU1_9LACT
MIKKNIMIYGGEFFNKGAQAMSFTTISRLKDEFPNHNITFVSEMDSRRPKSELENYNFEIITDPFARNNFIGENFIRKLMNKSQRHNPKSVKNLLYETDYLFDISGYALSSQWEQKRVDSYIIRLKVANDMGIKTIIMPQSMGPFDFNEDVVINIKEALQKVVVINPRESQGVEDLKDIGVSENVKKIPDMVLTNQTPINWNNIYRKKEKEKQYEVLSNSVAIVPNAQNFKYGNKDEVLEIYRKTIQYLRKRNINIYLTKHSHNDTEACHLIKNMFTDDSGVKMIVDDMTPKEFENLIKQFNFIIGSRFHSVVHAYKVGTPSIILGWATKYIELAQLFNQNNYVFDVRNNINEELFLEKIQNMINNYKDESETILSKLNNVKKYGDPFNYAFKRLK